MAEDTARAVGAGTNHKVSINGKECKVRPLSLRELTEVERACLRMFRNDYVQVYADNVQYLKEGESLIREKIDEVAKWDVSNLPMKEGYDPDRLNLTKALREYVEDRWDLEAGKESDKRVRRMAANLLDQGSLPPSEYLKLTGDTPTPIPISYPSWWMSATNEGMTEMLVACFSPEGVTRDEIMDEMRDNPVLLQKISHEIENLSIPEAKNG